MKKQKKFIFFQSSNSKEEYKNRFDKWWDERDPGGLNRKKVEQIWTIFSIIIATVFLVLYAIKMH